MKPGETVVAIHCDVCSQDDHRTENHAIVADIDLGDRASRQWARGVTITQTGPISRAYIEMVTNICVKCMQNRPNCTCHERGVD